MKILAGKESEYACWKKENGDVYGSMCFAFAEKWAELLEKEIDNDHDIKAVLKKYAIAKMHEASEGMETTSFTFAIASNILAKCWEYGSYLKKFNAIRLGFME